MQQLRNEGEALLQAAREGCRRACLPLGVACDAEVQLLVAQVVHDAVPVRHDGAKSDLRATGGECEALGRLP